MGAILVVSVRMGTTNVYQIMVSGLIPDQVCMAAVDEAVILREKN
jgi:hypothetical protein